MPPKMKAITSGLGGDKFVFKINPGFGAELDGSARLEAMMKDVANEIKDEAEEIFDENVIHNHPVTPPPYAESFWVKPAEGTKASFWIGNSDPMWHMVEFGTHPGGGETEALGYHPLTGAVDRVANRQ